MNLKGFFVDALSSALDQTVASPDDVIKHVTPEILSAHLPRPLWARLLTACLGAPHVDAQLVVETIGVPNLCEHIPTPTMWGCLAELGARAIGAEVEAGDGIVRPSQATKTGPTQSKPLISAPPPAEVKREPTAPTPVAAGPSIPNPGGRDQVSEVVASLDAEEKTQTPSRARTTSQRFRQSNTGIGRLAATSSRRPQAAALPSVLPARRGQTESDPYDVETEVGKDDWKNALVVEDEQLVDWSGAEETVTSSDIDNGGYRKR